MIDTTTPEPEEVPVGARVRALRMARRLSVRSVAARAGLSPSFLSQFERGLSDINVGNLRKVCQALGVTPAEVMDVDAPIDFRVVRAADRVVLHAADGVQKYPVSSSPAESVEVYIGELEPGASSADEAYSHGDGVEIVYVITGTAAYEVDGKICQIGAGDSIEHRTALPHRMTNSGEVPTRVMWIVAPPT